MYLLQKYKQTERELERESGVEVEITELDNLLQEIKDKKEEANLAHKTAKENDKEKERSEQAKAEENRTKAMESLGETQKRRLSGENEEPVQKKRQTRSETISYLKDKFDSDQTLRQEENCLKREENQLFREFLMTFATNNNTNNFSSQLDEIRNSLLQQQQQHRALQNVVVENNRKFDGMFNTILEIKQKVIVFYELYFVVIFVLCSYNMEAILTFYCFLIF